MVIYTEVILPYDWKTFKNMTTYSVSKTVKIELSYIAGENTN